MIDVIKLRGNTAAIGTSNTSVGSAKLVYLLAKSPIVVTQFDTVTNTQIGTIRMASNTILYLEKKATDVLTSNDTANCVGVAIAYTD